MPSKPPHRALQHSQLRHVSTRSPPDDEFRSVPGKAASESRKDGIRETLPADSNCHLNLVCSLGTHDESFAKNDVLVNNSMFPLQSISSGTKLRIVALEADSPDTRFKRHGKGGRFGPFGRHTSGKQSPTIKYSKADVEKANKPPLEPSFVFTAEDVASEVISKHPNLEVRSVIPFVPRM